MRGARIIDASKVRPLRPLPTTPPPLPSPLLLSFFSLSLAQFEKRLIARCGLVWAWVSLDASGETATERPGEVPDGVLYEGDLLAREEGADVQCYFDRSSLTLLYAFSPRCGARSLLLFFAKQELSIALSSLPSSSSSSSSSSSTPSPAHISQTLQSHQQILQRLASNISTLHDAVEGLKGEFRALWRARTGGVGDVFAERERDVGGLRI